MIFSSNMGSLGMQDLLGAIDYLIVFSLPTLGTLVLLMSCSYELKLHALRLLLRPSAAIVGVVNLSWFSEFVCCGAKQQQSKSAQCLYYPVDKSFGDETPLASAALFDDDLMLPTCALIFSGLTLPPGLNFLPATQICSRDFPGSLLMGESLSCIFTGLMGQLETLASLPELVTHKLK